MISVGSEVQVLPGPPGIGDGAQLGFDAEGVEGERRLERALARAREAKAIGSGVWIGDVAQLGER